MERYQIIKPEMAGVLRAIGKTNKEMAHEMALCWMGIGTPDDDMGPTEFYRYYNKGYQYFLKELEARDEK